MDPLIRVRLCWKHLVAAIHALQFWGDHLHEEARREPDKEKSDKIREEADDAFSARKSLWSQMQGETVSPIISASERANLNNTQIHEGNIKVVPWLIFTALLSGISLATAIFILIEFAQMQNNMARMAVHLMSSDALMLREGIMQPGDQWAGPEGNLEYGLKDKPKRSN